LTGTTTVHCSGAALLPLLLPLPPLLPLPLPPLLLPASASAGLLLPGSKLASPAMIGL
jgi:hypothetical protein